MISRIRLDAYGRTADEVERTLYPHADEIEKLLGVTVARGECVIERQMTEPDGCPYAFKGRLILHPDVSAVLDPEIGTAATVGGKMEMHVTKSTV